MIPVDPLQSESVNWRCVACPSVISPDIVTALISEATHRLSVTNKTKIEACKKFIQEFEPVLHGNHFLITDCKLAITQILDNSVSCLKDDDLALALKYCRELGKLISVLVPAENRCRGVLLFGLHAALAEIGRRKAIGGEIDQNDLRNNLLVSLKFLCFYTFNKPISMLNRYNLSTYR